jgi:hypothetical protein
LLHAVTVAHRKLGDVLVDRDEFVSARDEYQSAFPSLQALVKKGSPNTDYQYDLAGVYLGLGKVQKAQGDATTASLNF